MLTEDLYNDDWKEKAASFKKECKEKGIKL
jgi:hypothetical protein